MEGGKCEMSSVSKKIERSLKDKIENSSIKLTGGIEFFKISENRIEMVLGLKSIGAHEKPYNMQSDEAAFEAWALILHVLCNYDIQLSTEKIDKIEKPSGHYNRFLYRAMKFAEQYKN